jgi:hypothetical protein
MALKSGADETLSLSRKARGCRCSAVDGRYRDRWHLAGLRKVPADAPDLGAAVRPSVDSWPGSWCSAGLGAASPLSNTVQVAMASPNEMFNMGARRLGGLEQPNGLAGIGEKAAEVPAVGASDCRPWLTAGGFGASPGSAWRSASAARRRDTRCSGRASVHLANRFEQATGWTDALWFKIAEISSAVRVGDSSSRALINAWSSRTP